MREEIQLAGLFTDPAHQCLNLFIAGHVTGKHQRIVQLRSQFTHVLTQAVILVGED